MNEFNNKLNNNEEMQKNIDSNLQSQNENQNPYINNPFLYSETIKQESDKFNEHTANKVEEQPSHYVPEKNIEQPSHYSSPFMRIGFLLGLTYSLSGWRLWSSHSP